jgi:hypothetical protein
MMLALASLVTSRTLNFNINKLDWGNQLICQIFCASFSLHADKYWNNNLK